MTDLIDSLVAEWGQERPDLNADAMQVVGRVLKISKILEKRANSSLGRYEIHYTDLDVLATLRRSGRPYELSPKDLMQSVLITSGAMTALLDRLTKLDLVYRSPDPSDKRIKKAGLTEAGVKLIDQAIETRFQEADDSIQSLSVTEKEQLIPLLKKLLNGLD